MASDKPFVLSPEQQVLVLSALGTYSYEKKSLSGKRDTYKKLIAETDKLYDEIFLHHYGIPFMRKAP